MYPFIFVDSPIIRHEMFESRSEIKTGGKNVNGNIRNGREINFNIYSDNGNFV